MKKLIVFLMLLVLLAAPVCHAHGGSLDSNGGHWDHSTGTYHYHDGIHTEGSSSASKSSSSSGATYYRTTANVNMRMSASGSSQILQTIPANSKVTYMGSRSGNWIQVFYNLKTGWCHADYLVKMPKASVTAKPIAKATAKPTIEPTKKPKSSFVRGFQTLLSIPIVLAGTAVGGFASAFIVLIVLSAVGWLVSKILEWIIGLFG